MPEFFDDPPTVPSPDQFLAAVMRDGRRRRARRRAGITTALTGLVVGSGLGTAFAVGAIDSSGSSPVSVQPVSPAVEASASSSPAVQPTNRVIYHPFTGGAPSSGVTATTTTTGTCEPSSVSVRVDAYECNLDQPLPSGATLADPCFVDQPTNELGCPETAGPSRIVVVTATGPLPTPTSPPSNDPTTSSPWLIELSDGQRCTSASGAEPSLNGDRLNFSCPNGNVYGDLDRRAATWTATFQPGAASTSNTAPTTKVDIATAWF
jgi:hypothetical protein